MIDIAHPRPANERGWGPGWPDCSTEKWVPLEIVDQRGRRIRMRPHRLQPDRSAAGGFRFEEVGFPGGVRHEIAELVTILLLECDRRGYDFMDPGCWGAACRDIKRPDGTTTGTPSNHSWALALDINAPRNPNTTGPLVTDMPRWMPDLWNEFGFRWGGDYRRYGGSTVDAMHYEFAGTPADAKRLTEKARRELGDDMTPEEKDRLKDTEAWQNGFDSAVAGEPPPPDDARPARKRGYKAGSRAISLPKLA